jgi:dihydroneopterin aldolase
MDKVFIKHLEIDTIIGIYEHERTAAQQVIFDIELSTDVSKAAGSEDINDALNYKTLTDELKDYVGGSSFLLIETMAEEVAKLIMTNYGVQWLQLTLHKPNALDGNTDVGVIIERGTRPA